MYDLCAIGDSLIDFIPVQGFDPQNPSYQCSVGGTVCNLTIAAAKLGLTVLFSGKVGQDCLGDLIEKAIKEYGVDASGLVRDVDKFTTQTFVTLGENGERSFSFARKYGADIYLKKSEIPMSKMLDAKILHFSGMCMTDEPIRKATMELIKKAQKEEKFIAVDINLRESLWKSKKEMKTVMCSVLPYVTLYKSSDDEALFLSGKETLEEAAEVIKGYGCKWVIISCGEKGSFYYCDEHYGRVRAWEVQAVDTTGAGDSFFAAFLYKVIQRGTMEGLKKEEIEEMLRFANAGGALATTRRGGVAGAPFLADIEKCLQTGQVSEK